MPRPSRLQTQNGYDFYVVSSLLQKSLRRGDIVYSCRACNEMLPRYANYVWNRLMTVSAEDCADMVTGEVVALYDAWLKVNDRTPEMTKGRIFFAKAIVLLAKAHHSRDADELNILVSDRLPEEQFKAAMMDAASIMAARAPVGVKPEHFEIPDWVYDIHTRRGKQMGRTKEDFLREEHDALTDAKSIFGNFDDMLEAWGWVEPEVNP